MCATPQVLLEMCVSYIICIHCDIVTSYLFSKCIWQFWHAPFLHPAKRLIQEIILDNKNVGYKNTGQYSCTYA
jgi:hypothetical protein